MEKFLSNENDLPFFEKIILEFYFYLKHISLSEVVSFGLDTSNITVEKFPLILSPVVDIPLREVASDD